MQPDARASLVARLNARLRHHAAPDVIAATRDGSLGSTALVSSFGAESVVLLHLVSVVDKSLPVIFIDTEMLFTETLVYQQELAERLALKDLRIIRAPATDVRQHDPNGRLHHHNPDACCALRKTRPLERALRDVDSWITGRKRYHSGQRATLDFFEVDPASRRIKVNPLAHWTAQDVQDYIEENRLPRHPMVARGYPSIGCAPCTSPVSAGEAPRAGRWRGHAKEECGIHFANGRLVRQGQDG